MERNASNIPPFELMDFALITLATGKRAINLRELKDRITEIDLTSLYYHFYDNLLRPCFDDPEYRNDFALWAKHSLHDSRLAENLGILDLMACRDMEDLRWQLIVVIEECLSEQDFIPRMGEEEFHFLSSRVVVFSTGTRFMKPRDLGCFIAGMSTGSIFYHFIEARRREPLMVDDFSIWLESFGDETETLRANLRAVDYYFWTLREIR